jgi:hypothetical protein
VPEPGLGFAVPQHTTIAENLASHGYVVAGVTPTHSANLTALNGRAVSTATTGDPQESDVPSARGAAAVGPVWRYRIIGTEHFNG